MKNVMDECLKKAVRIPGFGNGVEKEQKKRNCLVKQFRIQRWLFFCKCSKPP